MTDRVYLHIGPHKTGTTYVQALLQVNRPQLGEAGVLVPGGSFAAQTRAIRDRLGRGQMPTTGAEVTGAWSQAVDEIREWRGPAAVLSHEMMSMASARDVRRLVRGLDGTEVHVVYTARDLSRVIPAMWQTGLRSRQTYTWEAYVRGIREPGRWRGWGAKFWEAQDAPAALGRWRRQVPHEHLHVVTVPRPGSPPELLWQRFCSVLGVDPGGHVLEVERSNVSLGTAEAELLRRINVRLGASEIGNQPWLYWIRRLAREVLEPAPGKLSFALPDDDFGWVCERSRDIVQRLRSEAYAVAGDLDELLPLPPEPGRGRNPDDAPEQATLAAAVDTVAMLVGELAKRRGRD